jgi:general stress protein YciG
MTSKRGFASMDADQVRKIAAMGGKAVPDSKRSFSKDRKLAAAAGRKGGKALKPEQRTFHQNREFAAECGRKGGNTPKQPREVSK